MSPPDGLYAAALAFGNGRFVVSDQHGSRTRSSLNGLEWEDPVPIPVTNWQGGTSYSFVYAGDRFFAEGSAGEILTSADTKIWSTTSRSAVLPGWPATLTRLQNTYVSARIDQGGVEFSTDGISWKAALATNAINSVSYGLDRYVAVGRGDSVFTTADLNSNWQERTPTFDYGTNTPTLWRVVFGNDLFVAAGWLDKPNGTRLAHVLTSPDGINWRLESAAGAPAMTELAYGNGVFVGFGPRAVPSPSAVDLVVSTNGADWTRVRVYSYNGGQPLSLIYAGGLFVMGMSNESIQTSSDGVTWTQQKYPGIGSVQSLAFGNGLFLAGAGPGVLSSPDATNWTRHTFFTSRLAAGDGVFIGMGNDGSLYQSDPIQRMLDPLKSAAGRMEWTVTGAPHARYRIEATDDFTRWTPLGTVSDSEVETRIGDPEAAQHPHRFYRTVLE